MQKSGTARRLFGVLLYGKMGSFKAVTDSYLMKHSERVARDFFGTNYVAALYHDIIALNICNQTDLRYIIDYDAVDTVQALTRPDNTNWEDYTDDIVLYSNDVLSIKIADIKDELQYNQESEHVRQSKPLYVNALHKFSNAVVVRMTYPNSVKISTMYYNPQVGEAYFAFRTYDPRTGNIMRGRGTYSEVEKSNIGQFLYLIDTKHKEDVERFLEIYADFVALKLSNGIISQQYEYGFIKHVGFVDDSKRDKPVYVFTCEETVYDKYRNNCKLCARFDSFTEAEKYINENPIQTLTPSQGDLIRRSYVLIPEDDILTEEKFVNKIILEESKYINE